MSLRPAWSTYRTGSKATKKRCLKYKKKKVSDKEKEYERKHVREQNCRNPDRQAKGSPKKICDRFDQEIGDIYCNEDNFFHSAAYLK